VLSSLLVPFGDEVILMQAFLSSIELFQELMSEEASGGVGGYSDNVI
jgi:hypothetical protein